MRQNQKMMKVRYFLPTIYAHYILFTALPPVLASNPKQLTVSSGIQAIPIRKVVAWTELTQFYTEFSRKKKDYMTCGI